MKCLSRFAVLFFAISVSFILGSCNFLNLTKNTSSIEVRLPHASSRSVYSEENEFSEYMSEDGKFSIENIDVYEVTIVSSAGKIITQPARKDEVSILIPDVEVGEWYVSFTAYAVDEIDGNKVRTIIAKTREPERTIVNADKTSVVVITAERVKYFTGGQFVNCGTEMGMNILSIPFQLRLSGDYILPISELIKFEVQTGDGGIVEVTKDGLIIPKKIGRTTIGYSRLQDGSVFGEISVRVLPVVKINCLINGVNVSGKYPLYTKIIAENGDNLQTMLSNFSVGSIMRQEGLESCDWYFDAGFTEIIGGNIGMLYLYEKHSAVFDTEDRVYEINIYADTRR
ncbi:MAG: hypothetical protein Q4B64_11460 [Spirochaetales bacterium]|nr:hypothetical protein [Spirochaetales bacterium]